jgi:5-methylcytosine-specific restriction protein A
MQSPASRLFWPATNVILPRQEWAVSSAVEHCFHTAGVTGSIPVPPTTHQTLENKHFPHTFAFGKRFCAAHETATRKASSVERSRDPLTRYNDAPWRRLRQAWLNAHPLCVTCEAEGRVTVAQVVDDPSRRLDWSNLRSLCKSCHDRHTAKTRGWGKASR